jgi:succinate dehydrogenase / fumarate reductase cytochrome b subunit
VSTVSVSDIRPSLLSGPMFFLLRRLHSLTGLLFGGYLCVHLLINATLIEGSRHDGQPTVFQMQVDKIHSLPFLVMIEWTAIFAPFLFHAFYGVLVTASGASNTTKYGYTKNWFYTLQRLSAFIILAFVAFHALTLKGVIGPKELHFIPAEYATESTLRHLQFAWWVPVVYVIGVLASTFHLANGFWTAAISWGLTVSKQAQQRFGYLCVLVFLGTTACGLTALFAGMTATAKPIVPTPALTVGQ